MSSSTGKGREGKRGGLSKSRSKVDDSERNLEQLLFGGAGAAGSAAEPVAEEDELEIIIDRNPIASAPGGEASAAAWADEDDEEVRVDLAARDRLKKLRFTAQKDVLDGTEYTDALRARYQASSELKWADAAEGAHDSVLSRAGTMLRPRARGAAGGALPPGRIQMKRAMDANNKEPANGVVTACRFSASGSALVVGSSDHFVRVFRVGDEEEEKEEQGYEKLIATRFADMAVSDVQLVGRASAEAVVVGRKPYFYSYDLESGAVTKVQSLMSRGLKSHELMAASPEGGLIAFAGAGGYVHLCSGPQKTWAMDLKMNTAVRSLSFLSESVLVTSGLDADVYVWDVRNTSRCLKRFHNEDGTAVCALSTVGKGASSSDSSGSSSQDYFMAAGSESGVVTLYNMNLTSSSPPSFGVEGAVGAKRKSALIGVSALRPPSVTAEASRSVMNLTTKITSMAMHPSGQLMAIASDQKRDQLKLVHLQSGTVFENWPTVQTPVRRVHCMEFSPNMDLLALGNNRGRVLLYRIGHYATRSMSRRASRTAARDSNSDRVEEEEEGGEE